MVYNLYLRCGNHSEIYRLEEVDEAFYKQLKVALQLWALVLMRDVNHPDIYWISNMIRHTMFRRFMKCAETNFLMQVVKELTRRDVILDLVLTNKEGLIGNPKAGGSLGCGDHVIVELVSCVEETRQ